MTDHQEKPKCTASCDICGKTFEKPTQRRAETAVRMHKNGAHKEQKATENKPKTKNQIPAHLTPDERAIAERVQAQSTGNVDDWFTLTEDDLNDFSLMANPFDLPPEAKKLQDEKRYAFRYCERKPQRIDELTRSVTPPLRWMLVTRNSLPEMAKYVDDILGCVCKYDQALLFKPWAHHEMVKAEKQKLAEAVDQSGNLSGKREAIQSQRGDDVRTFVGSEYKIGSRDEVMEAEEIMDSSLGVSDDASELGDLVVE